VSKLISPILVLATLAALGAWRAEARRSAAGAPVAVDA